MLTRSQLCLIQRIWTFILLRGCESLTRRLHGQSDDADRTRHGQVSKNNNDTNKNNDNKNKNNNYTKIIMTM